MEMDTAVRAISVRYLPIAIELDFLRFQPPVTSSKKQPAQKNIRLRRRCNSVRNVISGIEFRARPIPRKIDKSETTAR